MGEFARGLQERVAETRRSLDVARSQGDDYGVEVHGEELADLVRLGREHGLDVEAPAVVVDLPAVEARAAC